MQTVKSVSWVRMVLAFSAVLAVAGSGLALAAGPVSGYLTPKSSTLSGPSTLAHGGTGSYILNVVFTDNSTASFPPSTGATFAAALGVIDSTGSYKAPATGARDSVTGTFSQNGVKTTAGRIVVLTP